MSVNRPTPGTRSSPPNADARIEATAASVARVDTEAAREGLDCTTATGWINLGPLAPSEASGRGHGRLPPRGTGRSRAAREAGHDDGKNFTLPPSPRAGLTGTYALPDAGPDRECGGYLYAVKDCLQRKRTC